MNAKDSREWHRLFNAALNDQLDDAEKGQVASLLKSNAEARQLWFLYSDIECSLPEQKPLVQTASRQRTRSWFSWIPLTAAAAGLVVGLFSASVAFALGIPKPVLLGLHLFNPTFEETSMSRLSPETAKRFGVWNGSGEIVSTRSGVSPADGSQMLQFHPSIPKRAPWGAITSSAKVAQIVDLREWRDQLKDGNALAQWSAKFNSGPQADPRNTTFRVDVRAYSGELSILERPFAEREDQELAHSVSKALDDDNVSTWQMASGKLLVPPEADFLVIELKLFQADRSGGQIEIPHTQQFVDDVCFSLISDPRQSPKLP